MTEPSPAAPPIEVRADITPDAFWQTLRVVLIFACGVAIERFADNGAVIAAGMAAAAAVVTYGLGLAKLWTQHAKLTAMTRLLPDALARFR